MFARTGIAAAVTGLLLAAPLHAQVVVTPDDPQGWAPFAVNAGSSVAITGTQPRSGNGSLEINTPDGSGRVRYGTFTAPPGGLGRLDQVNAVGIDWFRMALSTVPAHFTPAFRLHVQDNFTGAVRSSELIWEGVYNGYPVAGPAAPTNQWVTENLTSQVFHRWVTGSGPTFDGGSQVNLTVNDWATSSYYASDAIVVGISIGFGSGANGTFQGFADNATLGFAGSAATTWNFEVTNQSVVPEPVSMALLATGLAGIGGGSVFRRRRAARV